VLERVERVEALDLLTSDQELTKPLVRVSVPRHLDDRQLQRIADLVHDSMVATFNAPVQDRFEVLTRHQPAELRRTHGRDENALFAKLACSIGRGSAILRSGVIVSLVEVNRRAQYPT